MNSKAKYTKPRDTRRLRSSLVIDTPPAAPNPDLSNLTISPTTNRAVKKGRRIASSSGYIAPTERLIHQSGNHSSITIQGSYNDVGRDQNNNTYNIGTYLGGESNRAQSKRSLTELFISASHQTIDESVVRHALVSLC